MFEWWQTVALSLGTLIVGGAIAVSSAYVQRLWAKSDTLEADRRAFKRGLEEEERQETRRLRRESVQNIRDFLALARRSSVGIEMEHLVKWMYENTGEIKESMKLEEFRKELSVQPRSHTEMIEFERSLLDAVANAPTTEIRNALFEVWKASERPPDSSGLPQAAKAIRILQDLLDDYVTKV